jgi:hypothetical protein
MTFLHELDWEQYANDDFQELNDANDGLGLGNYAANGGENWCHKTFDSKFSYIRWQRYQVKRPPYWVVQ